MSFVEKIEKLTQFDETKQAKEGQRDFRQNAAYSWSWLVEHTKEVNNLINKLNTLKVPEDTILLTKEYVDKEINIVKNDYALKNGDSAQTFKVKAGLNENEAVNLKQLNDVTSQAQTIIDTAVLELKNKFTPTGVVEILTGNVIPAGYILCNGALLNRTAYADLWAFAQASGNIVDDSQRVGNEGKYTRGDGSTNFRIPDLRGMFISNIGGNRGAIGVKQPDAIRNIKGGLFGVLTTASRQSEADSWVTGAFSPGFRSELKIRVGDTGGRYDASFDVSRVVPTAVDNRPTNIAFNYILKF